eukprot:TRINITY_DN5457_c0_g4_i1.p1 TRINITY_DN5457_c0_g4~~TRINITY_DN5457_c0_g4_i1.p1  ORF type:complete len:270 (-),score=59.98 TRINITY_DN5457_c0_g4_i1:263-1072(-)
MPALGAGRCHRSCLDLAVLIGPRPAPHSSGADRCRELDAAASAAAASSDGLAAPTSFTAEDGLMPPTLPLPPQLRRLASGGSGAIPTAFGNNRFGWYEAVDDRPYYLKMSGYKRVGGNREKVPLCEDLKPGAITVKEKCYSKCGAPGQEDCMDRLLPMMEGKKLEWLRHPTCKNHFECWSGVNRVLCEARYKPGDTGVPKVEAMVQELEPPVEEEGLGGDAWAAPPVLALEPPSTWLRIRGDGLSCSGAGGRPQAVRQGDPAARLASFL